MSGYVCTECSWNGKSPLSTSITFHGRKLWLNVCPECAGINSTLEQCCDQPGCTLTVSQGFPTPDGGYRQTCHVHGPGAKK